MANTVTVEKFNEQELIADNKYLYLIFNRGFM